MQTKSFLRTLFDTHFDHFITTRAIRLVFILNIGVAVFVALFAMGLLTAAFGSRLIGLLAAPVAFFLWVLFARLSLEFVIVLFRIADHTRDMAHGLSAKETPTGFEPERPKINV